MSDVVGSTELRSALGEVAADELRRAHDAAVLHVVTAHRGRLVKGTGDGVLASFDSASDGVAAAVAMQQAVHDLGRRRRLHLAIRVGVSAGDVSWEAGDCFGLPVVEAARLEGVAEPGQILCADVVRVLTKGRSGVVFGPARPLRLHGLSEPLDACEISWSPSASTVVWPWVGRGSELDAILDAWERATAGAGGLVLVAGEPGIGKTRLVEEVAARVSATGGVVWWGAAYEGEGRSYGPVTEMVEAYLRAADPAGSAALLGDAAGLVARVAPAVREVAGDVSEPVPLPAEAERDRTVDALVGFAGAVAAAAPLLVVVDDAHWADTSTVGWLRVLVRRAARLPVLVVVAYREVDLDRRHPLADALGAWRRDPSVHRLPLSGLDERSVGALLASLADQDDVPAELVAAITNETAGNPFFVREVILHLVEAGRIRRHDGRWVADPVAELGIPEGVREVIGRRLSHLSHDANRLLAVASVFDTEFLMGDVAAVAGLDEDSTLDAIDEALAAQVLRPGDQFDRYAFSHALFRHTLWAELNPSRQVRVHRAVAEQLERRTNHTPTPDEAILLARHFQHSAALPGAERGVGYALLAADHAAARYAAAEEHQATSLALELLPDRDERYVELEARAARAAARAGRFPTAVDHARRAVEQTARTDGPAAACDLAVELGRVAEDVEFNAGWPFGRLVDAHRSDLDPAGATAVQLLAWEVAETEYSDPDNPGIAVNSPERLLLNDLGSRLPQDQRPWGVAGYCHPSAQAVLDDYRRGYTDLAPALAFGGPGEYREAASALRTTVDQVTSTGYHSVAVWLLGLLGRLHLCFGELDRAAAVQAEGDQLLDRVEPGSNAVAQFEAIAVFRSQLVDFDFENALARVETISKWSARSDLHWVSGALRLWAAYLHAAMGHHQQGLDGLAADLAVIERGFLGAPNYPIIIHYASGIAWEAGSTAPTEVLERNLTAKVLEPDFCYLESDARWTAALLCALTGRADEARRWFQDAHDRITRQEAILLLPHICCDEARMEIRLGAAGDRRHGLRRLDEAKRWTDRIGLPAFVPRIDHLAEQLKG